MEVFKVFSVFSLQDLLSGPLEKMKNSMEGLEEAVDSLGGRMGKLAIAMAPAAIAAGAFLAGIGSCVGVAAEFEDSMAKVGAISRASGQEMTELEAIARELGATTRYTASQVAEAEVYLAMAGFSAKQNIAALPGVLNLAAATATDLGRASDISSDILSGFGMKAEEMGRAADVLALTCATANTTLEMLGETMKYVGPVARSAGMSLEETAAMAGLLGNVGVKGSMAGTTLKAMINNIAAPAGQARKTLKGLGIQIQDTTGNLRSPVTLLGELAKKIEHMGSAQQIATLKTIVGRQAIAGFAELIQQEGIGTITKYVDQLNNASGTVEEMSRRMNNTLGGSMRNMLSAWESLRITLGNMALPYVRKFVDAMTSLLFSLDTFAQSPVGNFLLKLLSAISLAIIGVTAFGAAMWALPKVLSFVCKSLSLVRATLLGLSWPMLLIIAALGALYVAYKNNFGGMADTLNRWWKNINLICNGVTAIFDSLKGSSFELRGELAKEIKAEGLEGYVVNIAKIFYRIKGFVKGVKDALDFSGVQKILDSVGGKLASTLEKITSLFGTIFGENIDSASDGFIKFGNIVGKVISFQLELFSTILLVIVNALSMVVDALSALGSLLTGDFSGACEYAKSILYTLLESFMSIADLFSIGDWMRESWTDAINYLSSIDLSEAGAKIFEALLQGLESKASAIKESVVSVFSDVRNLLPFSDAKEGPLSQLTLNGSKIMTTLAEGVTSGSGAFENTIGGVLSGVTQKVGDWWGDLFNHATESKLYPEVKEISSQTGESETKLRIQKQSGDTITHSYSIQINELILPNAKDGESFIKSLEDVLSEYGQGIAPA